MTFAKKLFLLTVLTAAATFTAAAQDKVVTFKLTQETQLGLATLPAGSYRMTIYNEAHPMAVVTSEPSRGISIMAVATAYGYSNTCKTNSLTLTPSAKSWNVTSVCFADSETEFYFPVPHSRKSEAATQTTDTAALAGAR